VEKLGGSSHPGLMVNSGLGSSEPDDILGPTEFKWTGTHLPNVDYVLTYRDCDHDDHTDLKPQLRQIFLDTLKSRRPGIETETYEYNDGGDHPLVFIKIYAPFNVLAREAEKLKLEMALDKTISPLESFDLFQKIGDCCNMIEDDEEDFISGPFTRRNLHLFRGHENKETFFRPAQRSYLVHNILINTDIGSAAIELDKDLSMTALPKLLHRGVFTDAFILHDPSERDPWVKSLKRDWLKAYPGDYKIDRNRATDEEIAKGKKLQAVLQVGDCQFNSIYSPDERARLNNVWTRISKYQPLDKVRNYFGEKIAFYFAWSGHMISMLWVPTVLGIGIFIYGLVLSIQRQSTTTSATTTLAPNVTTTVQTDIEKVMGLVDDMLATIKEAFDNLLTPIFAIIICLWGTIHTELWKRYRSTLAYEWDVNNYEHSEPDRPGFIGTRERLDPITGKMDSYYPGSHQAMKFATSFIILLAMILIVFIGVAAVIVYRIFVTIRVCPTVSSTNCLILNAVISSLLNAIFIIVIGKVYDRIAYTLTNWENHRTQTEYDNALILKLFAFQFANSYSSLFYIAFFRGDNLFMPPNGIFGLGKEFVDTCGTDGNCMSMLSLQVLILMIAKPMPKLLMDHVIPYLMRLFRSLKKRCSRSQVDTGESNLSRPTDVNAYIVNEYQKFSLGNFTIEEYMEKIIQFGYLLLFAASFPLAPLIALLTNLFDISTDAHRMLWNFRRPVAMISQNIGIWHDIVEFMNVAGVISNACLIAFTASWIRRDEFAATYNNMTSKLAIVLLVENVVLGLKYFISSVIPDVPSLVQLQIRRERYRVPKILSSGNINGSAPDKVSMAELSHRGSDPQLNDAKEKRRHQRRRNKRGGDDVIVEDEAVDASAAAAATGDSQPRRNRRQRRDSRRKQKDEEQPAAAAAVDDQRSVSEDDGEESDGDRGYQPFGDNSSPSRRGDKRRRRKKEGGGSKKGERILHPVKPPPSAGGLNAIPEYLGSPEPPADPEGDISLRQFGRHDTRDLTYF
ncbi:hypothetical protein BOX15_Mlig000472g1, partial [Macrostomum lignano]